MGGDVGVGGRSRDHWAGVGISGDDMGRADSNGDGRGQRKLCIESFASSFLVFTSTQDRGFFFVLAHFERNFVIY